MKVISYSPDKEHRVEVLDEPIIPLESNTIQIGIGLPKIKSHIKIGNLIFHNTHHFNWFHRKMWKLFFGFEIENIEEE
jgi:hypothetical protein